MTARTHQKERTRGAIVAAARELADTGGEVTMPGVAAAARVSEATAYRYFPDLVSLLGEAIRREGAAEAMASVADSDDPVERVAAAAGVLARDVLRRRGAVRAVLAGVITRPEVAQLRPGYRFELIEFALAPWRGAVDDLVQDLAIVVSAEAVLTLLDLCGLDDEGAVAGVVRTARALTRAAFP
ncbi:TetR/AcrR family transcriptional regulator, partial [Actinomycetospora sp. NBRC 106375]|uniref:TetR/AcrR family transcriptional regulator n=1 Tax=Actinomycetospora sp. NBRC 106375 TaxID=3032207 RepID=UPI0025542452